MTVFLGTLCSAIKDVKAPFMFAVENGIALYAMQRNRASSSGEGEVSWFFSGYSGNLWYNLKLRQRSPYKTRVCSAT